MVGEAVESPTPTPSSTALEARRPAMDEEKACSESCDSVSGVITYGKLGSCTYINLISDGMLVLLESWTCSRRNDLLNIVLCHTMWISRR